MTKTMTGWVAVLVALVPAGSALAHHSLANYDTTKAVRVKGTIIRFQELNPHTFLFLEQQDADGQVRRWAVEGPSLVQLKRKTGTTLSYAGLAIKAERLGFAPSHSLTTIKTWRKFEEIYGERARRAPTYSWRPFP